jgi:hypothetical protein
MLSHCRITLLTAQVMIYPRHGFAETSMFRVRRGLLDASSALMREEQGREGRGHRALLPDRLVFLLGPDRFGAGLRGFGFSLALHLP